MVGVARGPVARQLAVNLGASCERVFLSFQEKDARPFSHDEPGALFVEGSRGGFRPVVELGHHRSQLAEARKA